MLPPSLKVTRCESSVSYRRRRWESFRNGHTVGCWRDTAESNGDGEAAGGGFSSTIYTHV